MFFTDIQSKPPYTIYVRVLYIAMMIDPLSYTDRNSLTPSIPFLLYFSYNASSYGSLVLDWQDNRDTCMWGNWGAPMQHAHHLLDIAAL